MQVIKDQKLVMDHWQHVGLDVPLPLGDNIVPFARWQQDRDDLLDRVGKKGVQISGDDDLNEILKDIAHLDLIALEFTKSGDGRCYSYARLLRERYGYRGEIRAVGAVMRDQFYYMTRCGIDSIELREGENIKSVLKTFDEISVKYQSAADRVEPIYRYRQD